MVCEGSLTSKKHTHQSHDLTQHTGGAHHAQCQSAGPCCAHWNAHIRAPTDLNQVCGGIFLCVNHGVRGFLHKQKFIHIRAMTSPSMLAELTICNTSLLDRTAPIGTRIFELQPTSNRCVMVFFHVIIMVCYFTHQKNIIHIRAMTSPSMLAELTMRNASLLDRAAPIGTRIFELQPTSNRCVVEFLYVIIMVCTLLIRKISYTSES